MGTSAVIDALLNDWNENPALVAALNTLRLTQWVALLSLLNTEFNTTYIARAQTSVKPGQIEQKRTEMREAYEEIVFDTVSYSRVAADTTQYVAIINGLNGLIADYNHAVTLRLGGRSTDSDDTDTPKDEVED